MSLIEVLPIYEPKIDEANNEKVDLNIRDLQNKYPNGCTCCGTIFHVKKYSSMISSHFNTIKHKKKCIFLENKIFKQETGYSISLADALDNKIKENRALKKLNYEYKDELEKTKIICQRLQDLNIILQNKVICKNQTTLSPNLMDLE